MLTKRSHYYQLRENALKLKLLCESNSKVWLPNPAKPLSSPEIAPNWANGIIDKAYPLEYIHSNTWFGKIPFNKSALVGDRLQICDRLPNTPGNDTHVLLCKKLRLPLLASGRRRYCQMAQYMGSIGRRLRVLCCRFKKGERDRVTG